MKLQKDNTRTAHPILTFQKDLPGILVCLAIALPSWYLGKVFPLVGGAIIAIVAGMVITGFWTDKGIAQSGIKFTSKMILQTAVVLLGFGMNLNVILMTGKAIASNHHRYDCCLFAHRICTA